MDAVSNVELNISLKSYLVETLLPLKTPGLLPTNLATELDNHLTDPPSQTIPYSLLASISKWSRSHDGKEALLSHEPPLQVQDYSMIALLAGSVTSPERKFPDVVHPSVLAEEERKRQITDKKTIATLMNALLSIAGSGVATWFAAERWRHEWRVLLSFLVAVVVAVSETILYIIWQSRRYNKQMPRRRRVVPSLHKKIDRAGEASLDSDIHQTGTSTQIDGQAVRLRKSTAVNDEAED